MFFYLFFLKKMHLNNNEEQTTTVRSQFFKNVAQRKKGKKQNVTPTFCPNMIYDSAGELHVMIQHVDQGFVQQRTIQKYCSETENRQQCRSITPQLHIVHSGIQAVAARPVRSLHHSSNHPGTLYNMQRKYAVLSDTFYSLLLS